LNTPHPHRKLNILVARLAVVLLLLMARAQVPGESAGKEFFFPQGFSAPINRGSGIAGPTPQFGSRDVGASTGAQTGNKHSAIQKELNKTSKNSELMIAAVTGDHASVKSLLDRGADANAKNKFGSTALMGAAAAGHMPIVQALLQKKADVNTTGQDGCTALIFAAKNGHGAIVQALIAKGADLSVRDDQGRTPLMLADEYGYAEVAFLIRKAQTEKKEAEEAAAAKPKK